MATKELERHEKRKAPPRRLTATSNYTDKQILHGPGMAVSDPLRTLWDALEGHGCRPRGEPYEFRARCPAHEGDNPTALQMAVGADGRALLWCHAHQCDVQAITATLGLQVADLFPDGHPRGRRYPLRPVMRSDFDGAAHKVANVLYALEQLDEEWTLMLTCRCPYCGKYGLWLRATDERVNVDCSGGCGPEEFTQALLGLLAKKEEAA
jgi:hypothetical protein